MSYYPPFCLSTSQLRTYELDHPEPEMKSHDGFGISVEDQLRHVEWLDQRWNYFVQTLTPN